MIIPLLDFKAVNHRQRSAWLCRRGEGRITHRSRQWSLIL